MTLAVKTIKLLYPQLFHVTCIAHLLHNCALKVKAHYDIVDQLIARLKALIVKNKSRQAKFDAIGQPPQPIVTRWAGWIKAALYYASNLPTVKEIVRSFEDGGLLLRRAKEIVEEPDLCQSLLAISQCYAPLATLVVKVESANYTIKQASSDLAALNFGDDPCKIQSYLAKRLSSHDLPIIMEARRDDISPATYGRLQLCQATSASVERSFSMLRKILAKDRQFSAENVKKYVILHYNSL